MFVIHKRTSTYVLTLFHIWLISINIIYLQMSILLCTFVSRKERYIYCLTFKTFSVMKQTNKKFFSEKAAAMAAGATINMLYNIGIYGRIYSDKVMRNFTIFFKYKQGQKLPHLPRIDCTKIRRWKDVTEDALGVSFDFDY